MKQYEHTGLKEPGVANSSTQKLPYAGREILLRYFYGEEEIAPFVSVVGFIVGDYMRKRPGTLVPVTDVEPVTDPSQIKELTDLLRQRGWNKPIDFW